MKNLSAALAAAGLITAGLAAVTTAPASADPYTGTIPT